MRDCRSATESVNFVALLPVLLESQPTVIPEIWMGHHENGLAFRAALERLTEIRWASLVLGGRAIAASVRICATLTVTDDATIFTALRVIDTNRWASPSCSTAAAVSSGWSPTATSAMRSSAGSTFTTTSAQAMTRKFVHGEAGMSPAELRALPARPDAGDADPRRRRPAGRLREPRDARGRAAVTMKLSDWVFGSSPTSASSTCSW